MKVKTGLFVLISVAVLLSGCSYVAPPPPSNEPPQAYITSISPSEVTEGEVVEFIGHGTDVDGEVVGYRWRSHIDGELSLLPSFETDSLSVGSHTIYFMVQDNNGAWSPEVSGMVTVHAQVAAPATIVSFAASSAVIEEGQSVTLSWEVSDATSITIDQGIGAVSPSGDLVLTPEGTTTYRLTAIGGGATATADVTVTVVAPEADDPEPEQPEPELAIVFFQASPMTVLSGGSTTLSWQTTGATQVVIFPDIGAVGASGSRSVTLFGAQTHTFILIASDGDDTVTVEIEVESYQLGLTL